MEEIRRVWVRLAYRELNRGSTLKVSDQCIPRRRPEGWLCACPDCTRLAELAETRSDDTPARGDDTPACSDDDDYSGTVHYKEFEIPRSGAVAVYGVQIYTDRVVSTERGEYRDKESARGAALRMQTLGHADTAGDDTLLATGMLLIGGRAGAEPEIVWG